MEQGSSNAKSGEKNNGIKKRIFTIHFRALTASEEITYRAMMRGFILYHRGKMVGGIHDDRLLVKPIKSAISYIPTACHELPAPKKKQTIYSLARYKKMVFKDLEKLQNPRTGKRIPY